MSGGNVRCAGCGNVHSGEFIRCAICKTPTRVSRAQAEQEAADLSHEERAAARRRGCLIVVPAIVAFWVAVIWWALA